MWLDAERSIVRNRTSAQYQKPCLYGLIQVYKIINFQNFQLYMNLIRACTITKI